MANEEVRILFSDAWEVLKRNGVAETFLPNPDPCIIDGVPLNACTGNEHFSNSHIYDGVVQS